MKRIIAILCLSLFCSNTLAWSITCNTAKNESYCYSWFTDKNRITGKSKKMKIDFMVYSGSVDTNSVCSEQKYGSVDAITCKRAASNMFKDACHSDNFRRQKDTYCGAYRRFVPSR